MSIQIEVPLEALSRAPVAQALSDLMLLLGGHPVEVRPSAAAPKAARRQQRRPRKKPALPPVKLSADPKERWRQFVIARPENTQRFLALLEQHGQLSVSQAVEYLDLPGPKSMGGLTGALRRWATASGMELPFQAIKNAKDERVWVWVGVK